jgi:hypothetical protein
MPQEDSNNSLLIYCNCKTLHQAATEVAVAKKEFKCRKQHTGLQAPTGHTIVPRLVMPGNMYTMAAAAAMNPETTTLKDQTARSAEPTPDKRRVNGGMVTLITKMQQIMTDQKAKTQNIAVLLSLSGLPIGSL